MPCAGSGDPRTARRLRDAARGDDLWRTALVCGPLVAGPWGGQTAMGLIGWSALIVDRVAARLFPRQAAEGSIGRPAAVIVGIAATEVAIELRQWFTAIIVAAAAVAE